MILNYFKKTRKEKISLAVSLFYQRYNNALAPGTLAGYTCISVHCSHSNTVYTDIVIAATASNDQVLWIKKPIYAITYHIWQSQITVMVSKFLRGLILFIFVGILGWSDPRREHWRLGIQICVQSIQKYNVIHRRCQKTE
jgi:hypothetical protein